MFTVSDKISLSRKERRKLIFAVIMELTEEHGLFSLSLKKIAKRTNCSESLIKLHYGGIKEIRNTVINHAIENNIKKILNTPIQDFLKS